MTDAEKELRAKLTETKWRLKLSKAIYERINIPDDDAAVETVYFKPKEWQLLRLAVARSIGVDDIQIHDLRQKIEDLKKAEKEAET